MDNLTSTQPAAAAVVAKVSEETGVVAEMVVFLLFISLISFLAIPPNVLLLYLSLARDAGGGGGGGGGGGRRKSGLSAASPILSVTQCVAHLLVCLTSPLDVTFLKTGGSDDVVCVAFLSVKSVLVLFCVLIVSLQGLDRVSRVRNIHKPFLRIRPRVKALAILLIAAVSTAPFVLEMSLTGGALASHGCYASPLVVDVAEGIFAVGCVISVTSVVSVIVMLRGHSRRVASVEVHKDVRAAAAVAAGGTSSSSSRSLGLMAALPLPTVSEMTDSGVVGPAVAVRGRIHVMEVTVPPPPPPPPPRPPGYSATSTERRGVSSATGVSPPGNENSQRKHELKKSDSGLRSIPEEFNKFTVNDKTKQSPLVTLSVPSLSSSQTERVVPIFEAADNHKYVLEERNVKNSSREAKACPLSATTGVRLSGEFNPDTKQAKSAIPNTDNDTDSGVKLPENCSDVVKDNVSLSPSTHDAVSAHTSLNEGQNTVLYDANKHSEQKKTDKIQLIQLPSVSSEIKYHSVDSLEENNENVPKGKKTMVRKSRSEPHLLSTAGWESPRGGGGGEGGGGRGGGGGGGGKEGGNTNTVRWDLQTVISHDPNSRDNGGPGASTSVSPPNPSDGPGKKRAPSLTLRRLKSATVNAAKRGVLMIVIFFVCYLPLMVILMVLSLDQPLEETALLLEGLTLPISYFYALLCPIVVMRADPELRAQAMAVIRRVLCCQRSGSARLG